MKLNSFILICIFWVLNISSFTEGSQEIYFREHQSDLLNSLTHTNENSIKSNGKLFFISNYFLKLIPHFLGTALTMRLQNSFRKKRIT